MEDVLRVVYFVVYMCGRGCATWHAVCGGMCCDVEYALCNGLVLLFFVVLRGNDLSGNQAMSSSFLRV